MSSSGRNLSATFVPLLGQPDVFSRIQAHVPILTDGYVTAINPSLARTRNALSPLTIPTPDATGQVVEPGVIHIPGGFTDANGDSWLYLMSIAGYAGGDNTLENPSIRVSNDRETWQAVTGAPDPLVAAPGTGHNFDQSIALGPDGNVYITYMSTDGSSDFYWEIHSSDLVTWTDPVLLKTNNSIGTYREQAPVCHWDGSQWNVWVIVVVPASPQIKHFTGATLAVAFAAAGTTCTLVNAPGASAILWEMNMCAVGAAYCAVVSVKVGSHYSLYFMVSEDGGDTWTLANFPLLQPQAIGQGSLWDRGLVYRGAITLLSVGRDGARFALWYSAADSTSAGATWGCGYTEIWFADQDGPRHVNGAPSTPSRWYVNPLMTVLTSGALTTNNCYLYVAYSGEKGISVYALDCTPAVAVASSTLRIGISIANDQSDPYAWTAGQAWGTLVCEADATIDGNSATHQLVRPAGTQNLWIPPRTYFGVAGAAQGGAINVQQGKVNNGDFSPYGSSGAGYNATPAACLYMTGVSGALPSSFTPAGVGAVDCGVGFELDSVQPSY